MPDAGDLRAIALGLPQAVEVPHHDRPSFRVGKRIFATLPPERGAVRKLPVADQTALVSMDPEAFSCAPWAHQGWTRVELERISPIQLNELVLLAWRQVASKTLQKRLEDKGP